MGVGWTVGGFVVGVGVATGWVTGEVHPLMQSIMTSAVVISPYTNGLMDRNMKYRYIILRM
jgi:hypothetical protein